MKIIHWFSMISILAVTTVSQNVFADEDFSSTINTFKESPQAKRFFEDAYGYAVFPTVGQGAAFIGATYGKGQLYTAGQVTGSVSLFGLSIGPQLGGTAYSEIIFFKDKRAYDEFASNHFNFNAAASVTAITANAKVEASNVSSYASANTSSDPGAYKADYDNGVAVLVRGKAGLMAEASIGAQHFSVELSPSP